MRKRCIILIVLGVVMFFTGCGGSSGGSPAGGGSGITLTEVTDADETSVDLEGTSTGVDGAALKLTFSGEPSGITDDGNVTLVCSGDDPSGNNPAITVTQSETDENSYDVSVDDSCPIACESCTLTINDSVLGEETSFSFENSCFVGDFFRGLFISDIDYSCWVDAAAYGTTGLNAEPDDVLTYDSTDGVLNFDATGLSVDTAAGLLKPVNLAEQFELSVRVNWNEGLLTRESYNSDGLEIQLGHSEGEGDVIIYAIDVGDDGSRHILISYNSVDRTTLASDNKDYVLGEEAVMTIGQNEGGPYAYFTLDGGAQQELDLIGFPPDLSAVFDSLALAFRDFGNVNTATIYEVESTGITAVIPE